MTAIMTAILLTHSCLTVLLASVLGDPNPHFGSRKLALWWSKNWFSLPNQYKPTLHLYKGTRAQFTSCARICGCECHGVSIVEHLPWSAQHALLFVSVPLAVWSSFEEAGACCVPNSHLPFPSSLNYRHQSSPDVCICYSYVLVPYPFTINTAFSTCLTLRVLYICVPCAAGCTRPSFEVAGATSSPQFSSRSLAKAHCWPLHQWRHGIVMSKLLGHFSYYYLALSPDADGCCRPRK